MGFGAGAPLAPSSPGCDPVPPSTLGAGGRLLPTLHERESEDPEGIWKGRWVWGHGRAKEWGCMAGSRRERKKCLKCV